MGSPSSHWRSAFLGGRGDCAQCAAYAVGELLDGLTTAQGDHPIAFFSCDTATPGAFRPNRGFDPGSESRRAGQPGRLDFRSPLRFLSGPIQHWSTLRVISPPRVPQCRPSVCKTALAAVRLPDQARILAAPRHLSAHEKPAPHRAPLFGDGLAALPPFHHRPSFGRTTVEPAPTFGGWPFLHSPMRCSKYANVPLPDNGSVAPYPAQRVSSSRARRPTLTRF